jgi:hypothetical protein
MTSSRKQQANKKNARRSTGPRTSQGKAISRLNAAKHGLSGKHLFVNPGYDDEERERFDVLIDHFTSELKPVGVLETKLVGKIAECFVRAERAARCEIGEIQKLSKVELLSNVLQRIELKEEVLSTLSMRVVLSQMSKPSVDEQENRRMLEREGDARKKLRQSALGLSYLITVLDNVRDQVQSGGLTSSHMSILGAFFGVSIESTVVEILTAIGPDRLSELGTSNPISLSAEEKARVLLVIDEEKSTLSTFLKIVEARDEYSSKASKLAAALPESKTLDRILKYESSIERQLYRALGQLERLQRARAGEFVPPPFDLEIRQRTAARLADHFRQKCEVSAGEQSNNENFLEFLVRGYRRSARFHSR